MPEIAIALPKFHPKQQLAFDVGAQEILFGGATRGGKSYFVRRALIEWCSQIPGLQCDIFRLNYADVIAENMDGETSFPVLLAEWQRVGLVKINKTEIEFWNKSKISLEYCGDDKAMQKHQGIAKHVRVFSEATQIPERRIRWLSAWVTMSEEMLSRVPKKWAAQFPKVISVTNPVGTSAPFYKREYVKAAPAMKVWQAKTGRSRVYIPALVSDNPSENADATKARVSEMGDPAIADAMLNANWDAQSGEFYPEWDERRHVTPDFNPPDHWYRYRTFDWGTAEPFCCYWVAVSDGELFTDEQGRRRWFPRGALIYYREWYGCDPEDHSRGLRMRNEDIAAGILSRSEFNHRDVPTLADSKPFAEMGGYCIASVFKDNGVTLTLADTSRVSGWSQLRSRLIGVEIDSNRPRYPMIYFCEQCTAARDYFPALTRHPSEGKKEDAQEHGEPTHALDAIRYGVTAFVHTHIRDKVDVAAEINRTLAAKPTMRKITGGII